MMMAFGLFAPATFASGKPTSYHLDVFFGLHGPLDYSRKPPDRTWPTEEQSWIVSQEVLCNGAKKTKHLVEALVLGGEG